jgi:hypothetical protein
MWLDMKEQGRLLNLLTELSLLEKLPIEQPLKKGQGSLHNVTYSSLS